MQPELTVPSTPAQTVTPLPTPRSSLRKTGMKGITIVQQAAATKTAAHRTATFFCHDSISDGAFFRR